MSHPQINAQGWSAPALSDRDRRVLLKAWRGECPRVSLKDGVRLSSAFPYALQVEAINAAGRGGYCMFPLRKDEESFRLLQERLRLAGVPAEPRLAGVPAEPRPFRV